MPRAVLEKGVDVEAVFLRVFMGVDEGVERVILDHGAQRADFRHLVAVVLPVDVNAVGVSRGSQA